MLLAAGTWLFVKAVIKAHGYMVIVHERIYMVINIVEYLFTSNVLTMSRTKL